MLGLLGALDPYKHKVNIGMIDQSRDASAVSLSESKSSQDSCKHLYFFQVNSFMTYKQVLIFLFVLFLLLFCFVVTSLSPLINKLLVYVFSPNTWVLLNWYSRPFNM